MLNERRTNEDSDTKRNKTKDKYAPVNANQGNSLAQQAIDIIGKLGAENKKSHK